METDIFASQWEWNVFVIQKGFVSGEQGILGGYFLFQDEFLWFLDD